jgi:hypothetical protein
MRHSTTSTRTAHAVPLLRWIFERNGNAITCEIEMNDGTCDVAVIPHWDSSAGVVEHFDGPMGAMERHAELAVALLDEGWTVTDRA